MFIVENRDTGTLKNLVEEHFGDDKWREVFLLVGSMLPRADNFFTLMQEDIDRTIKGDDILIEILGMVEKMVKKRSEHPIALRRSFGLCFILDRTNESNLLNLEPKDSAHMLLLAFVTYKVDELINAIAETLELNLEFNLDANIKIEYDSTDFQKFSQETIQDIFFKRRELTNAKGRELDINIEIAPPLNLVIKININNIQYLLTKYLHLHACLTTENYASRELKEKLLEGILALPEELSS